MEEANNRFIIMVQDDAKSELLFYRWAPHGILYSSGTEDKVAADKEAKFWPTNKYTFSPPVCFIEYTLGWKVSKCEWMFMYVVCAAQPCNFHLIG